MGFLTKKKKLADAHSTDNSKTSCLLTPNPVVITTGEKVKVEPDFQGFGLYGISLTRTYRSKNATGSLFGPNWLSNLDQARLNFNDRFTNWAGQQMYRRITLVEANGARYEYRIDYIDDGNGLSATYSSSSSASAGVITWENGEYTLDKQHKSYRFDAGGLLSTTTDQLTGQILTFYQQGVNGAPAERWGLHLELYEQCLSKTPSLVGAETWSDS